MARSRRALFGIEAPIGLKGALERASAFIGEGRWKVRVLYDTEIRSVEAVPYKPKPCRSAALVDGGSVSYAHKTVDRPELDELTRRARLLAAGILSTVALVPSDLDRFVSVSPINAMLELGEVTMDIGKIIRPELPKSDRILTLYRFVCPRKVDNRRLLPTAAGIFRRCPFDPSLSKRRHHEHARLR
jgi:hypothetical protein